MDPAPIDAQALAQSGVAALRQGDARTARASFERVVAAGQADAASYLGLAHACRRLGDAPAALAALDRALSLDARNLGAVILKADLLAELGDTRTAASFYQFAVRVAPPADEMPAALRDDVKRAKAMCDRYASEFAGFLVDRLARHGLGNGRSTARVRQALDILMGKKQIYFQQPTAFFFPELPQIQFYDREDFPWLNGIEAATDDIRAELKAVAAEDGRSFVPYVQQVPGRPRRDLAGLEGNPSWSAYYLWKDGDIVLDQAARCPKTLEALAAAPQVWAKSRSPSVLFSLLRPGASIPPHTGLTNTRLICHLPLIVPPGCALRVGNDTRVPVEGKAWVFDDTIEHEAWNRSDHARVILLFEIWRPELSEEERTLIAAMFDAIDAYRGEKPVWSI